MSRALVVLKEVVGRKWCFFGSTEEIGIWGPTFEEGSTFSTSCVGGTVHTTCVEVLELPGIFPGWQPVEEQKLKKDRKTCNCVLCRASVLLTFCQPLSLSPELTQGTWPPFVPFGVGAGSSAPMSSCTPSIEHGLWCLL